MRNITGHAGGAKRFGAEYRILQFGFVQFR